MKINQKGFGAAEMLLVIVLAGIVGGVGWFVLKSRDKVNDSLANTNSASNSTANNQSAGDAKSDPKTDPTEEWFKYTSQNKKYTVSIPDGWELSSTKSYDDIHAWEANGIKYAEGNLGKVQTIEGGRDGSYIAFSLVYNYNGSTNYEADDYKKVKSFKTANNITVDSYTKTHGTPNPDVMDPPKGTVSYVYELSSADVRIRVIHEVAPGESEQTKYIEQMIGTLKLL